MLVRERGKGFRDVGASAGPVSVKVESASLNGVDFERLRNNAASRSENNLSFELMGYVEERMNVAGCQLNIDRVMTAEGKNLLDEAPERHYGHSGMGEQPWRTQRHVYIQDASKAKGPLRIEGKAKATFAVKTGELRIEDVFGIKEGEAKGVGVTIGVKEAKLERTRAHIGLTLSMPRKEGAERSSMGGTYGLFLEAPGGTRHSCGRRLQHPMNEMTEEGRLDTTIMFDDLPMIVGGKWALVYVYPEKTITKEYPFVVENVPVPELGGE